MQIVNRLAASTIVLLSLQAAGARTQDKPVIPPVIRGNAGPCTADFFVTGAAKKPLNDAKIQISLEYGFAGTQRLDLQIGTNGDGKARFEGLPQKLWRSAQFEIRHGKKKRYVRYAPADDCNATHEVALINSGK